MSTFHCTSCGRAIFRSEDVLRRVTLSKLDDHRVECFAIRDAIDPDSLTRYDVSLHEGWYCCRFIMMRMLVDKFGTGRDLLVYADSVVEIPNGEPAPTPAPRHRAVQLGRHDHDAVIAAHPDELLVVKHGAIWCPPCRHMDTIIDRIVDGGSLLDVRFFELDIDHEPELAARFENGAVPFFVFYYGGRQIPVDLPTIRTIDGGIVGAMSEKQLVRICAAMLARARSRSAA